MQLLDDDPWRYLDRELADDRWLAPPWLHPECVDACTALTFGTCCKQPGSPLARQLNEAATGLEGAAAARLGPGDEIPGPRLARQLTLAHKLLSGIPDRHPTARETELFQLSCLSWRIAGCLEDIRRQQEPQADLATCRRRTDLNQVLALADERSRRLWELALRRLRGLGLRA